MKSPYRLHFREQRCRAFTLIELLVVISIIAVLAAIIVPAITAAKVSSQRAACISNMRQIGAAMILYANENNGTLPETSHTTGVKYEKAWIYTLAPYLGDVDKVRICPADPKGQERLKAQGTSYTLNSFVFVPKVDPFGRPVGQANNNIRAMSRPASVILAFNISDSTGVTVLSDHTHSDRWTNWKSVCADIQPDRFTSSRKVDHSSGSSNFIYADGHVENRQAEDLKTLIERGENFARLPEE